MNTLQWKLNEFTSPKGGSALSLSCVSPRFRQPSLSAALAFRELISPSAAAQESVPLSHNPLRPRTDFREEKPSSFRRRLLGDSLPHPPGPTSASHLEERSSLLGLPQVSESKFNQRGEKVQKQRDTVKQDKNNNSLVIRHLMRRADSLEKTPMLRGIGGRRRRGRQRRRRLDGVTDSMDMSLGELPELVTDREAWRAAIHGVTKNRTRLSD